MTNGGTADAGTPGLDFGRRIGLIGDVHGNLPFALAAIAELTDRNVSSIVQLGDFGVFWNGGDGEYGAVRRLRPALRLAGIPLLVVLGNHDGYTRIDSTSADPGGVRRIGEIWVLPRSGRATVADRRIGWLAGAGSVDRSRREEGVSWWRQEIPTVEEARGLGANQDLDIVLAHDALSTIQLETWLAGSDVGWDERDLEYARRAWDLFTHRVLAAVGEGALVLSGHYHARHRIRELMTRPDGTTVTVRNEIVGHEWQGESVGVLETATLHLETFAVTAEDVRRREQAFRAALRRVPGGVDALSAASGVDAPTLKLLRNGHLAVPASLLSALERWIATDAPEPPEWRGRRWPLVPKATRDAWRRRTGSHPCHPPRGDRRRPSRLRQILPVSAGTTCPGSRQNVEGIRRRPDR